MKKIIKYEDFINEMEQFNVKEVKNISDLEVGDEVFDLGVWKFIDKVEGDTATLVDPRRGYMSLMRQKDLDRLSVLVKVPM